MAFFDFSRAENARLQIAGHNGLAGEGPETGSLIHPP